MRDMKFRVEHQDQLWCVGLILVAAGCFVLWFVSIIPLRKAAPDWLFTLTGFVLATCCFAAFGAGIGALFKRKLMGASIVTAVVVLVTLLFYLPGR